VQLLGELFKLERAPEALQFSGERFTSSVGGQIEVDHLHRYCIARHMCRDKTVLDIASGEGYGAALLAQVARYVVGVEVHTESVAHASRSYSRPNLVFLQGDARRIPLRAASFDIVVSFETLEHFAEHEEFLREIRRLLRPDGVLLLSTPDRDVYSPVGTPANPYHVRELTREEMRLTLNEHFDHVSLYVQRPFAGSAIMPDLLPYLGGALLIFEKRDPDHLEVNYGLPRAPLLMAIASDQPIGDAVSSLYIDASDSRIKQVSTHGVDTDVPDTQKPVSVQVYPFGTTGYYEDTSISQCIQRDVWQNIVLELPYGIGDGPLRIDPVDSPCVVHIGKIILRVCPSGDLLWIAETPASFRSLKVCGSSVLLSQDTGCLLLSYGSDPQIILPRIESPLKPLELEMVLRVDSAPGAKYEAIERYTQAMDEKLELCNSELRSSQAERILVTAELKHIATERNEAQRELDRATDALQSAQQREVELEQVRERLQSALASLGEQVAAERQIRAGLENSVSWRLTSWARALMGFVRAILRRH
jgi:SAM-dependent methyltransferase